MPWLIRAWASSVTVPRKRITFLHSAQMQMRPSRLSTFSTFPSQDVSSMGDAVPVVNLFSFLYSTCHTYPQALQEYHTSDSVLERGFTRALAQRGHRFDE